MHWNRRIATALLGAFVLGCAPVGAEEPAPGGLPQETQADYLITLTAPVDELYPGDLAYVTCTLSEPTPVYALEAELTYDPEMLELRQAESPMETPEGIRILQEEPGRALLVLSRVGQETAEPIRELLKLAFAAKAAGESQVTIRALKIVQADLTYQNPRTEGIALRVAVDKKPTPTSRPAGGGGGGGGGGRRPSPSFSGGGVATPGGTVTTGQSPVPTQIPEEPELEEQAAFADLGQVEWAQEAIETLAAQGALQGYPAQEGGLPAFRPEQSITRAEMVQVLMKLFGQGETPGAVQPAFEDVNPGDWFADAALQAARMGIVNGEEGRFYPDRPITRQEFVALLARCASVCGLGLVQKRSRFLFGDQEEIAPYAAGYVEWLYLCEILNGDETGCFRPKDKLSRAEAAVGIYQLLQAGTPPAEETGGETADETE